MMRKHGSC